ncbi:MAG: cation diffusion facilitator family transporter [Chloroflexi bacterium]|nr:cation diffusion facilitator family transporter [Chloroflexota bacterium]MDA8237965.1 cation diffusion facilitator family transporter [Chloroflexota bacterium]
MPHVHSAAAGHRKRLIAVFGLTLSIFAFELVGGLLSNSLALLADAGHVFTDVFGIGFALTAIWLAGRPATSERTFGYLRLEILAAVGNALLLFGVSAFVLYEAWRRLAEPPEVASGLMLAVAVLGLAANGVSLYLLRDAQGHSLNMRGAYLEVMGDLLGSVAVIVAAIVIAVTGWTQADALASVAIGLLIIPRTWALLREALDVLLEATPKGIDLDVVREHILEAPGVVGVHDLHAWTITSGMNVVSAHVVLAEDAKSGDILDHLGMCLSDDFDVRHSTFQLETPEHVQWEARAEQAQL